MRFTDLESHSDVAATIVDELRARDLLALSSVRRDADSTWAAHARASAERRLRSCALAELRVRCCALHAAATAARSDVPWLHVLVTIEEIDAAVGARPACAWRSEWTDPGDVRFFRHKMAWASELRELSWSPEHAEAFVLLYERCNARISRAARAREPTYASSTWLVCEALLAAATRQRPTRHSPPPLVYAKLTKRGGLAEHDESWTLLDSEWVVGRTWTTTAVALAFSGAEVTNPAVVSSAIPRAGPDSEGVVAFRSRGVAHGAPRSLRSAVAVGSRRFALPPFTRVTLERIDAPGDWQWQDEVEDAARGGTSGASSASSTTTQCYLYTMVVEW